MPASDVIRVHPANPHYYEYRGRPMVLITSAEHYGAVVNRAFDYERYLAALQRYSLNYTRIYPGVLFEAENKWMAGNTLGPAPDQLILPWARSTNPGQEHLYDLDRWDDAYFERLHAFMRSAEEHGVIVEVCFFNAQYEDTWPLSPLYAANNIQGETACSHVAAQTLAYPGLTARYDAYVRKLVRELNPYGNLILEICDEPLISGTEASDAVQWLQHLLEVIRDEEAGLPNRHLVAQQIEGLVDFSRNPGVDALVAQYAWGPDGGQVGGLRALDEKYAAGKPIDLNETDYYPSWYAGDAVAASRVEAWEFIVGGGSSFNHLNGRFTAADPTGDTEDNHRLLKSLQVLAEFMASLDYLDMKPDRSLVYGGMPAGARWRCLAEAGRQYALYLHHSAYDNDKWKMAFRVQPGDYQADLVLRLPPGEYRCDWIDPAKGVLLAGTQLNVGEAAVVLPTPRYTVDIGLRIVKVEASC